MDFCSIDLRGTECGFLKAFDFNRYDIKVIALSCEPADEQLPALMAQLGYDLVVRMGSDSIFKQHHLQRLPLTTVICAVWHGDMERRELMQEHARNLASQTVPIEMVYVFDGKDEVPESLPGRKLVAHEKLTIYQAWNVGLSIVETPFVMNLNLDDRLAPDAVEHLEGALIRNGAALAGGDWKVCYSQPETDRVEPCYPTDRLPFVNAWPPPTGTVSAAGAAAAVNVAPSGRPPSGAWTPMSARHAFRGAFPTGTRIRSSAIWLGGWCSGITRKRA